MKNISFSIFNAASVFLIILSVVLTVLPFNLINLEQAERIAKWKSEYEQLSYCFSLVKLYEGSIIPSNEEAGLVVSSKYIADRIKPYFNLKTDSGKEIRYKYTKMNGSPMRKTGQFYFDNFFESKDGALLSVKKNESAIISENMPLFIMFVDINGKEKPNKIGQDIFFINIFRDSISASGNGRPYAKLKSNCSPIGSGVYCSEYYLLGGRF